jgi:ArsR family transcriptional regulator
MKTDPALNELENLFLALADKTRLRLLNLMAKDEICVCFLVETLGESQPKISRHLAYLRNSGLVTARREGKWMHYGIRWPKNELAAEVLSGTLRWLGEQKNMQGDSKKLSDVCCSPQALVTLARAPKPAIFSDALIAASGKGKKKKTRAAANLSRGTAVAAEEFEEIDFDRPSAPDYETQYEEDLYEAPVYSRPQFTEELDDFLL